MTPGKHVGARGALMVEVLVTGMMVAVASLGAAAALISGLTLEQRSERTMSEVATAENIMERIRYKSMTDFDAVSTDFLDSTHAARGATGSTLGGDEVSRRLSVSMPLNEASVPGAHDLDGNGEVTADVDPTAARVLVINVDGSDKLRLRTAVINHSKLGSILLERRAVGTRPVAFGETRDPADEDDPPVTPPAEPTETTVSAASGGFDGNTAVVILTNSTIADRKPTSITISPSDDKLFFQEISLEGTAIFTPDGSQKSGTVTMELSTGVTFSAGESPLRVGDFFKVDKKKGNVATKPKSVTVTVAFDDGSVATVEVR